MIIRLYHRTNAKSSIAPTFSVHFCACKNGFHRVAISSARCGLLRFGGRTRRIAQDTAKGGMHPSMTDFIQHCLKTKTKKQFNFQTKIEQKPFYPLRPFLRLQKWISSRSDFIRTLRIVAIRRPNTPNCARYRQRRYASVYDGFHSTLLLIQKPRSDLVLSQSKIKTPVPPMKILKNGR